MTSKQADTVDFFQAMHDVKPIAADDRVLLASPADKLNAVRRREAAVAEPVSDSNFLSEYHIELQDPNTVLEFKRDGVQHGVYRSLRQGKYPIDARLDLHRMTVEQARAAVFQFIRDCMSNDIRCALITHGKGEGREQPALLKSCVAHWLPEFPEVLAFHSAQKHHGATGATYVLLRKSERKKLENWEKHHKK
ncbi:DNA endonuclease SmrA [Cellvibrio polysaccharolyticus]|uniref:DNA endonuclease SmrA n=1 Tax=Cellvibrio polysaccharolyticus TaxID=2082724 RepID=A0A928YV78_9GAMM|nr:DNA endonuclease SmrA [Cellvibrio polysaccharolyticus]MBE8718754.1 DNA endonuclease SmrA [Cellvibrio polysaccharolyticus]